MKLLIVDDEKLTRNGLKSSIDWSSLQISELYEAENGIEGIRLASQHHPEIILTDVRMPQMDGIQMAKKIRDILPDTIVIFMSGYSDKEYLKAAIQLNAVNYVEKPLNPLEIKDAVYEAVKRVEHLDFFQKSKNVQTLEQESQLAFLLTHASQNKKALTEMLQQGELNHTALKDGTFTSVILQFLYTNLEFTDADIQPIQQEIHQFLPSFHVKEIHTIKYGQHLCYFLYGPKPSRQDLYKIAQKMQSSYLPLWNSFAAIGDTQNSIYEAYNSYLSAVILLQRGFFCDTNAIFSNDDIDMTSPAIITDFSTDFQDALTTRKQETAFSILNELVTQFRHACTLLPNQVKDIYYKFFLILQSMAQQTQISSFLSEENQSIWDMISSAANLTTLHSALLQKTEEYFTLLSQRGPSNHMIFSIKDFIQHNYQNDSLSVKSVSDHVMRSAPYVCTFFKAETGQTLTQYITEYRIEKARTLLENPRYKISEVASRVGYTDVNYFGKIFRKAVGLTPSEYRGKLFQ